MARAASIMLENLPISYTFKNFPKIFPIDVQVSAYYA